MKFHEDLDFMLRTSTSQETLALLSELTECLNFVGKNVACSSQSSKEATMCDKILRACIHQFGIGFDCPAHCESLQALAERAYWGYITVRLQHVPLYLEKLLYHLLRGATAQGLLETNLKFADLLYAELAKNPPPPKLADDYRSIVKSAFSVLWKSADTVTKMDKTLVDLRVMLSTQLQAVRFLVLLEHDVPILLLQEPPFFTSLVARHAVMAAVTFEAQRSPLNEEEALFLSNQLFCHLVVPLLERRGVNEPLAFQDSLCIFELTVVRSRHLCKNGCFSECKEVLQQSSGYFKKLRSKRRCFNVVLNILSAGVELNKVLALSEGSVGPFFVLAAEALNASSDAAEALLRMLIESCQLFISALHGHATKSKKRLFNLQDIMGVSAFMENYYRLLSKLLNAVPPENTAQQLALKKLLYHFFQLYTTVVYDFLQTLQGSELTGLPRLLVSLQRACNWMLDMLEGLTERDQAEYLDVSGHYLQTNKCLVKLYVYRLLEVVCTDQLETVAYCVSRLAYSFYFHKMYLESTTILELFCKRLVKEELFKCPELTPEKLQNCFRLQVENYRKLGFLEEALQAVALWLISQCGKITEQMAEPISTWVRVKMDANKNGADDLRLKTLKDSLEGYNLAVEILLKVLCEELKAYKSVRGDTGRERFNVICDLLDICSEDSIWVHERAVVLIELAQVLCYHDFTEQTECSALDSVHEALQLLDTVLKTPQNEEQLQDDKARALLWLYICTIEDKTRESMKQEQRTRNAHGREQKNLQALEHFETNDLGYEEKSQEDKFLYLGISFNLSVDSVQSKCLDDALALWKQLLSKGGIPAVHSIDQTTASLHIMAALYRVMRKPLQAMESYFLIVTLSDVLGDSVGRSNALCHISKLFFLLECPGYAAATLKEAESCLQNVDRSSDSCLLTNQTLLYLRSTLCLATFKVEEGVGLLLEILQNPALQRHAKVWYILQANALQLTAAYLGLPASTLPLALRQKLCARRWKTPELALSDAHKLYRSILLNFSLVSNDTSAKVVPDHLFLDHGDNLVQKWQVLADMFVCSERFVSLFGKIETVSEAKAFCLEALKISMKLQSTRWCVRFLVLKSELELQCGNLEQCYSDLEQVLFLVESSSVFEKREEKGDVKIRPQKGGSKDKKPRGLCPKDSEEEPFLREISLEFIDTVSIPKGSSLITSPVLRSKRKKRPSFQAHPAACCCSVCSDPLLSTACLRWLVVAAQWELAVKNRREGLHLLEASLKRCATVSVRISSMVAYIYEDHCKKVVVQSTVGLLDDVEAQIYETLAKHSISANRLDKKLWKLLEDGLTLVSTKALRLPGLQYQKASLLLSKAVATICLLTATHDCMASVLSCSWSWKSPFSLHGNQRSKPAAEKIALGVLSALPLKNKTPRRTRAAQKGKPKRIQGTKSTLPVANPSDPFALVNSDSEAPPVDVRPPVEHCTPAQKLHQATKMILSSVTKSTHVPDVPFVVFDESSTTKLKTELTKAPRVSRRMKSRLKVLFSDDDLPDVTQEIKLLAAKEQAFASGKAGQGAVSTRKQASSLIAKMEGCTISSSEDCAQPARPGSKRSTRRGKILKPPCEESACKALNELQAEEKEALRTIKEGLEVFRASDAEAAVKGSRGRPTPNGTEEEEEVLRQDAGVHSQEILLPAERGLEDPFDLYPLATSLEEAAGSLSMDSAYDSLQAAFHSIGHCPPGVLYSHICQLMAMCVGSQDPIATAYLVSESVSVTLRHQIMSTIHKRRKMKASANASKQLEALCLQEGNADPYLQHLSELQTIFEFHCPCPAKLGAENQHFQEQLRQIPCGTTVCVMTVVSIQPGAVGDILLLTRLEKDATPVTIQIQTMHAKVSLSAALREFEAILQKQKEISNFTDKEAWWLGRIALDKRMKVLTESLEEHVLSCWRGALLPAFQDQDLVEEATCLQAGFKDCGCREVNLALLKVMLIGSHLLTPQDVQCLARGLGPTQPQRAQKLLQEAVDKLRSRTAQTSSGHLVLVLDKHLQKLPWENIPCLRSQSVTRLPSLRFLLSHSLARKYREQAIFDHGVNSSSTFYVLNPQKNLSGTEMKFKDWFQSEPGWKGVVGEAPNTDQVALALEERDLYIYAGHGAGARFVDSILKLDCRAVALLFGCSSAALAVQGNLEGTGIILKFIMAGCPLVLGNLWDVTDRDIDRYMEALLKSWLKAGSGASLLQYAIQSRQAPRLKYIIGAAPVAYGLPVTLQ